MTGSNSYRRSQAWFLLQTICKEDEFTESSEHAEATKGAHQGGTKSILC